MQQHQPVLLEEVLTELKIKPAGVYVDATFDRGGHSKEILKQLSPEGILVVIDKDPEAIKAARALQDKRLVIRQGSFANLQQWLVELNLVGKVDGILLDLGVSSPQLDIPERGFSFMVDGPLDMRMDLSQKTTAANWLQRAKEREIAEVLQELGEEKFARRIAKAVVAECTIAPILTTKRLAEIVSKANPKWEKFKHPATRSFQAIRIFINNELNELADCLEQCLEILHLGGRLLVISFHSLEDRIVKRFGNKYRSGGEIPIGVPLKQEQLHIRLKVIGHAIRASDVEVKRNIRARSAVLRVMEKLI